jgi:hypothetical protein
VWIITLFSHENLVGSFLSFNFNHKHVMTIPNDGHIHSYVIMLVESSSILRLKVESNFDFVSFFLSYFPSDFYDLFSNISTLLRRMCCGKPWTPTRRGPFFSLEMEYDGI